MQSGMLNKLRKAAKRVGVMAVTLVLTSCSPAPKEHVTLKYQVATDSKEQLATVREIITAFEKQFPYIHVEPSFANVDLLQLGGKPGPDVFFAQADNLGQLAEKVAVDLTPSVTVDKKIMDPFYPDVAGVCKSDSRQFMMPVCYSSDILVYNSDLVQKAVAESKMYVNMQDIDFESLPKFAQMFVKKDGNTITQYAIALPRPLLLIQSWGAQPLAWNDVAIKNELSRKALTFYASLVNEHHIASPPEMQSDDGIQLFKRQKVVCFVGRTEDLPELEKIHDFRWDIGPVPKGPKRQQPGMPAPGSQTPPPPVEVWPRYSRLAVGGNCIWANSPHFAEAWEFVKFYSSEPAQRIFAHGRAGVPAVKVVAESADCLRKPPEHVNVLIDSRAYSHLDNTHGHPFWDEFNRIAFIEITGQLLEGKLDVETALSDIEAVGKELLDKSKAAKGK